MQDEAGEDAKVICVPPGEPRWADVHDISHLPPQLMAEIQHFFEIYKALEPNKYSSTEGIGNRARDRESRSALGRARNSSPTCLATAGAIAIATAARCTAWRTLTDLTTTARSACG